MIFIIMGVHVKKKNAFSLGLKKMFTQKCMLN